jgi:hypothetical protein
MDWPTPSPRLQRGLYLAFAYYTVALLGVRMAFVPAGNPLADLALFAMIQLSLAYACIADSRVLGRPLIRTTRWMTVLFCVYATPLYVLWSRRAWGILVLLILIVSLVLTFYFSFFGAYILRGILTLVR